MSAPNPPKRLIYCVDGTWCGPDGVGGLDKLTNVYQIYASIFDSRTSHKCTDDGYYQEAEYEPGVGSADDLQFVSKLMAGAFGDGYLRQIQKVYEKCCTYRPQDEVWLFGFSRGAFVVRAVAGLLHYLQAISSAGTSVFDKHYKEALQVYESMQRQGKLPRGRIHRHFLANTRPPPKIKFIGAFDTVKAVNDRSLFDLSFNDSTLNLRHALALHEDREAMIPEYIFPDPTVKIAERSFVQAWFAGAHIDMGGSSAKAGLSLYPLQWMLLESQSLGLTLSFTGTFEGRAHIDNPLQLVFPADEEQGRGVSMWSCELQNGLRVKMQDLRKVHELQRYSGRYDLKLNKRRARLWPKQKREVFDVDGNLKGWSSLPQGTVIHPSVYLLLDEWTGMWLDTGMVLQNQIEYSRQRMLGMEHKIPNQGFWNERITQKFEKPGAIRVLVCGNSGVGKSSLVNKVFEVEVTPVSTRHAGLHNVWKEIRYPGRPDLVVHDSGGFETGDAEQVKRVKDFVKEKSTVTEIDEHLHVIWFCTEVMNDRPMQPATKELFKIISWYAHDVSVVVVATKMDNFIAAKVNERRMKFKREGRPVDMDKCDQYAETKLQRQITLIEKEVLAMSDGRVDACVAVCRDDDASIQTLTETTAQCFGSERARLLYIRAQCTRIDLKITLAIGEVIRIYRRSVLGTAALAGTPAGPTITSTFAAIDLFRKIVICFGLPTIAEETVMEIARSIVWTSYKGNKIVTALSEGLFEIGRWLVKAPLGILWKLLTVPIVVPVTAQLLLELAADMILILARSFREASVENIGQPLEKDLRAAARAYRPFTSEVHKKIERLVFGNPVACFRTDKIKVGFEAIIQEFRSWLTYDIALPKANTTGESNIDAMADALRELDDELEEASTASN